MFVTCAFQVSPLADGDMVNAFIVGLATIYEVVKLHIRRALYNDGYSRTRPYAHVQTL